MSKQQLRQQLYRDRIGNAPLTSTALLTMSILDAIQKEPNKGAQLAALATTFTLVMEQTGLNVHDVVAIAHRVMQTAQGKRPEFKGATLYIEKELLNAPT